MVQSNPATKVMVGEVEVSIGIDTGGGIIDLSGDVIRKVGAKKMPGSNTWTDWTGQEFQAQLFKIPSVTIDGRTFRNLVAEQANEPASGVRWWDS
jgi:hypothetical protein